MGSESIGKAGGRSMALLRRAIALLLLAAAVGVVYHGPLDAPFVFDDARVTDDPRVHAHSLPEAVSVLFEKGLERRVGHMTFAMNHWLGGLAPRGYRIANILIHVLNAWLVHALVIMMIAAWERRGLWKGPPGEKVSFWIAALWALNPIQIMAVTYVVQRLEGLLGRLLAHEAGLRVESCAQSQLREGQVASRLGQPAFGLSLGLPHTPPVPRSGAGTPS